MGGQSQRNAPVLARIRELAIKAEKPEGATPQGISLDLVFDVAGPLIQPPYQGLRTGRYWPSEKALEIQIATPEAFASNEELESFLHASLEKAVDRGSKYFNRKNIPFVPLRQRAPDRDPDADQFSRGGSLLRPSTHGGVSARGCPALPGGRRRHADHAGQSGDVTAPQRMRS